jgi:hypothetical protein
MPFASGKILRGQIEVRQKKLPNLGSIIITTGLLNAHKQSGQGSGYTQEAYTIQFLYSIECHSENQVSLAQQPPHASHSN